MSELFDSAFISGLIGATMRMATPIIFATLGEILAERSGVLNLGIEGIMLMGAMTGFLVTFSSGSIWTGVLAQAQIDGQNAISSPSNIPTRAAANTPVQMEPEENVTRNPVMAPISMMPSIPRFRTPDRSARISPKVANMIGVAMRMVAPMSPDINAISKSSLIFCAPALVYIP